MNEEKVNNSFCDDLNFMIVVLLDNEKNNGATCEREMNLKV
jgi:hypothetical protein